MKFLNYISFRVIPFLTGQHKAPDVYLTNINYLNNRQLKKSMLNSIRYIKGKCVDIGSGTSPYKRYIIDNVSEYIAIDKSHIHKHMFQTSKEKHIDADIKDLPFNDSSIDSIILTQVLEHIDNPFEALSEVKRVIKRDGIIILSVPFIYHAHATPYDYFRFSEYGLKNICKDHDFEILEFEYQGYLGTTLFSILNGFIWQLSTKSKLLRNTILLPFLLLIFTVNNTVGVLLDFIKLKDFTPNFWLVLKSK